MALHHPHQGHQRAITEFPSQLPRGEQVRTGGGIVAQIPREMPEKKRQLPSDSMQLAALAEWLGTVEERLDLFKLRLHLGE